MSAAYCQRRAIGREPLNQQLSAAAILGRTGSAWSIAGRAGVDGMQDTGFAYPMCAGAATADSANILPQQAAPNTQKRNKAVADQFPIRIRIAIDQVETPSALGGRNTNRNTVLDAVHRPDQTSPKSPNAPPNHQKQRNNHSLHHQNPD